ncbi:GNAT family N-acetyltransferase [Occultella aeris]|uniref:GNAT family N-acetyltransferase n=1 Tax=Occultella aeris TaxID=2761496 RepID=UPI0012EA8C24|nr:GNAT family N-acetyltransferase [Occultella aeris]
MTWSREQVRRASQEWAWVPPGSDLVAIPGRLTAIVAPGRSVSVIWSSGTDHESAWHLVEGLAADHDAASIAWTVTDDQRDLEEFLVGRRATLHDATEIQARALPVPPTVVDPSVRCALVDSEQTVRDAIAIATRVWGGTPPTDEQLREQVREATKPLDQSAGFQVVAYVDGVPAATGGVTRAGEVARLWGACTVPEFRRRGAYRAATAARMTSAADLGCTLALVNALVDTSAPILARLGFTSYGSKRTYRLVLEDR